jgi:hypothetical protein
MKVRELIQELIIMPQDIDIAIHYDSKPRYELTGFYICQKGYAEICPYEKENMTNEILVFCTQDDMDRYYNAKRAAVMKIDTGI